MNNTAYFAIIGDPGKREAAPLGDFISTLSQLHNLATITDAPNLLVLGASEAAHFVLPNSSGVFWGHLFDRKSGERITSGDHPDLVGGPAEQLLEHIWGGYAAIRQHAGGIELLRDPSGGVACYHCEVGGIHILTSRPDLLFEHRVLTPEIDWTVVAQSLAFSDLRPASTALRRISELLPGAAAQIDDGGVRIRCAWSPWHFAGKRSQIADPEDAITRLRSAGILTFKAWRSCFQRPVLEISGGLDSSIVAAGLEPHPSALCLTFGPPPGDPDERPYARAVAERLGLELIELIPDLSAVDVTRSDAHRLPRPCARAFSQALDRPIQALVADKFVDAFIGGGGGDSVFCHLQSALPVIDRFEREGPGIGVIRSAIDIARLSRTNMWEVLRVATRRWGTRRSRLPKPKPNRFLAREALRSLPWPSGNPWLEAPAELPPGKKRHGWALIAIQNHVEGYGREAIAPHISPLLSQPILEACLAIPTWLWCEGGNNRAIAREAFRDMLPASIIDRRTKGGFDTFVVQLIEANKPTIAAMLREGSLARQGLLDLERVDDFLEGRLADNEGVAELWALVDTEAWANGWEHFSPKTAFS